MESTERNRLVIIGASGHGKVVAYIAGLNGYSDIVFLDNNPAIRECAGYPVLGPDTMTDELYGDVFVAVGNASVRKMLMEKYQHRSFPVLVHPSAVIAEGVNIGNGSVIMPGVIINPDVLIGKGCIMNTSSSVDHDCTVGEYCHISVGAHLAGTIVLGDNCWIGAGATVSNNISICSNVVIGAGAVVVEDVKAAGTYIGVPAKSVGRPVL